MVALYLCQAGLIMEEYLQAHQLLVLDNFVKMFDLSGGLLEFTPLIIRSLCY